MLLDAPVDGPLPVPDAGDGGADARDENRQVSLDASSICFRKNGQLRCWGRNLLGTLGDGTFTDRYAPQLVPGLPWVNEVATDEAHICARLGDGTVRCWGSNGAGQLGIGYVSPWNSGDASAGSVPTPTPVLGVSEAIALTNHGAGYSSCANVSNGGFFCWGPNPYGGELPGLTPKSSYPIPVEIPSLSGATRVVMGADFTCALFGNGTIECSGRNLWGELGDGTTVARNVLAPVSGVNTAIDVACRQGAAYALLADHTVVWWGVGVGSDGQIAEQHLTPVPLGRSNVSQVAAAGIHACVRLTDGSVECSGLNDHGQLGDGTVKSRSTMAPVVGISDAVDIAAGVFNTCAIVQSGALYCWGDNEYGQMGSGAIGPPQTTPLPIGGL